MAGLKRPFSNRNRIINATPWSAFSHGEIRYKLTQPAVDVLWENEWRISSLPAITHLNCSYPSLFVVAVIDEWLSKQNYLNNLFSVIILARTQLFIEWTPFLSVHPSIHRLVIGLRRCNVICWSTFLDLHIKISKLPRSQDGKWTLLKTSFVSICCCCFWIRYVWTGEAEGDQSTWQCNANKMFNESQQLLQFLGCAVY